MLKDLNNKLGFTLIELLIVVAIIAILAAIAIPNFLAAQTRSKTARIKGEFSTLATAIEAYNVDANSYPIYDSNPYGGGKNGVFGVDDYSPCRFDVLTTPIAYLTSIPKDPYHFSGHDAQAKWGIGYFMYTWNKFITASDANGGPFLSDLYHTSYWSLWSAGPYGKFFTGYTGAGTLGIRTYVDNPPLCPEGDVRLMAYDPSNGVTSRGGVYRTSKQGQY